MLLISILRLKSIEKYKNLDFSLLHGYLIRKKVLHNTLFNWLYKKDFK